MRQKCLGVSPLTNTIYYGLKDSEKQQWVGQKTDVTKSAIVIIIMRHREIRYSIFADVLSEALDNTRSINTKEDADEIIKRCIELISTQQ